MPPRLWSSLTQEEIQVSRKVRFVIAIFLPNLTRFFGFLNFLATNSISFQCFRVKMQLHSVVQEVVWATTQRYFKAAGNSTQCKSTQLLEGPRPLQYQYCGFIQLEREHIENKKVSKNAAGIKCAVFSFLCKTPVLPEGLKLLWRIAHRVKYMGNLLTALGKVTTCTYSLWTCQAFPSKLPTRSVRAKHAPAQDGRPATHPGTAAALPSAPARSPPRPQPRRRNRSSESKRAAGWRSCRCSCFEQQNNILPSHNVLWRCSHCCLCSSRLPQQQPRQNPEFLFWKRPQQASSGEEGWQKENAKWLSKLCIEPTRVKQKTEWWYN